MMQMVEQGLISEEQVEATMAAKNRPMFCVSMMSANLRRSGIDSNDRVRIDRTIGILVDITGACERIFKSPVPLLYSKHSSRFLTSFLFLMPFALWESAGAYWNHWISIPETYAVSFFLLGIEKIGMQIEEPFSILPLEAFCDGAIAATMTEMNAAVDTGPFDYRGAEDDPLDAVEAIEQGKPLAVEAVEQIDAVKTVEAVEPVDAVEAIEQGKPLAVEAVEQIDAVKTVEAVEPVDAVEAVEAVEPAEQGKVKSTRVGFRQNLRSLFEA